MQIGDKVDVKLINGNLWVPGRILEIRKYTVRVHYNFRLDKGLTNWFYFHEVRLKY